MKRIVVLFDSSYKTNVLVYLAMHRIQYSISTDTYMPVVRLSLPYAKGVRLLAQMRRLSIPYKLI